MRRGQHQEDGVVTMGSSRSARGPKTRACSSRGHELQGSAKGRGDGAAAMATSSRSTRGSRDGWDIDRGSSRGREKQVREGHRGRGSRDIAARIVGCQPIDDDEQRRKEQERTKVGDDIWTA